MNRKIVSIFIYALSIANLSAQVFTSFQYGFGFPTGDIRTESVSPASYTEISEAELDSSIFEKYAIMDIGINLGYQFDTIGIFAKGTISSADEAKANLTSGDFAMYTSGVSGSARDVIGGAFWEMTASFNMSYDYYLDKEQSSSLYLSAGAGVAWQQFPEYGFFEASLPDTTSSDDPIASYDQKVFEDTNAPLIYPLINIEVGYKLIFIENIHSYISYNAVIYLQNRFSTDEYYVQDSSGNAIKYSFSESPVRHQVIVSLIYLF
jgi:hypothetical protein